jgi:hypothetical protein
MAKNTAPKFSREEIESAANQMLQGLVQEMGDRIAQAYDALTEDERAKVESDPFCHHPVFVVRCLAMAIGDKALSNEFEAEATKPHTRRIKSILAKRYW